jgi:Resolvase, N terminal domain
LKSNQEITPPSNSHHPRDTTAIRAASRFRPGYQKLVDDARREVFDVVVAEALDRLTRDQEDVAGPAGSRSMAAGGSTTPRPR